MKKVFQSTLNHNPERMVYGDCLTACLATLTGIDKDKFPVQADNNWDKHYSAIRFFLKQNGLGIVWFENDAKVMIADNPYIASGKSPRGNYDHAVIMQRSEIVHDPHPDGGGILDTRIYEMLVPYYDFQNQGEATP